MLGLLQEKESIRVVNDQIGSPTYAPDLARAILDILRSGKWVAGIYHFSNAGRISWFDFAIEIRAQIGATCKVEAIPTSDYPTPAKRPRFSLLNTDKISEVFGLKPRDWKEALRECLGKLRWSMITRLVLWFIEKEPIKLNQHHRYQQHFYKGPIIRGGQCDPHVNESADQIRQQGKKIGFFHEPIHGEPAE